MADTILADELGVGFRTVIDESASKRVSKAAHFPCKSTDVENLQYALQFQALQVAVVLLLRIGASENLAIDDRAEIVRRREARQACGRLVLET